MALNAAGAAACVRTGVTVISAGGSVNTRADALTRQVTHAASAEGAWETCVALTETSALGAAMA